MDELFNVVFGAPELPDVKTARGAGRKIPLEVFPTTRAVEPGHKKTPLRA
jgi:hypothetical protein